MRTLALSITALVLLGLAADTARAQESIPDPFLTKESFFGEETIPDTSYLYATRFRPVPESTLRTENGVSVPLGSVRLVGQGSSYYPGGSSNQKVRNESLHIAWALSDDSDLIVGAWRFKHRQEGLERIEVLTVGIGIVRRY